MSYGKMIISISKENWKNAYKKLMRWEKLVEWEDFLSYYYGDKQLIKKVEKKEKIKEEVEEEVEEPGEVGCDCPRDVDPRRLVNNFMDIMKKEGIDYKRSGQWDYNGQESITIDIVL